MHAQYDKLLDSVQNLHEVHAHLDAARDEDLAFTNFPRGLWRQIWSNNPNERVAIALLDAHLDPPRGWQSSAATLPTRTI